MRFLPSLLSCSLFLLWFAVGVEAPLPAQLVPKVLTAKEQGPPTRPAGEWEGTARDAMEGGQLLEYPIELRFTGDDAALRLEVSGKANVSTGEGQKLTVAITAAFAGTFGGGEVRMRSERVDVRIVETGEVIPSAAQQLEGKLNDGAITGRVGSDDEGWTTFTVRPKGRGARAEAVVGFTGRWRGTCKEPGPDGKELQYPITVVFSGTGEALRAEVAADVRYPVQGGGTTPVEYRATFAGKGTGPELQLQSERIEIRLTEQNRTVSVPAQQLTGRLDQGVLRARIAAGGQQDSELELRPEGAAPSGTEQLRTEPIRTEPVRSEPARTGGAPSPYGTLVLERQEIRDPAMANVVSHTLLVPKGWRFAGGAQWSAQPDNFVNFVGDLEGPAKEGVHFGANRPFTYSSTQSQTGNTDISDGRQMPDGSTARRGPRGPGEVAVEVISKQLRPSASGVRLVEASRLPDLEQKMRDLFAPQLRMMEEQSQRMRTNGPIGVESNTWLVAERARIAYEEGGVAWEEEIRCAMLGFHGVLRSEIMTSENGGWTLMEVRTVRAPAGQLEDRLPTLWMLAGGLRDTPRWGAAVAEIRLKILEARTQGMRAGLVEIRRRGETLAASRADLSAQQMQSWQQRQDSLDKVHKATIDSIRGVHDFRDGDGKVHTVTNHYDRAFVNGNGNVILTNDPNYRPTADPVVNGVTWDEMRRLDPFRGDGR